MRNTHLTNSRLPKFVNMTKKFTTTKINMVNMTEKYVDGRQLMAVSDVYFNV